MFIYSHSLIGTYLMRYKRSLLFHNWTDCTNALTCYILTVWGLKGITPCHRWCPAVGNAQPHCAVFPAACRPAGSLSALSLSRPAQTAWHHRLAGSPICTAGSQRKDGGKK